MLEFIPKLSCSYCDMTVIIDQEKYYLQPNSLYHYFLSLNTFKDFNWAYHVLPCEDNKDECFIHVACPKCVVGSGDYTDYGFLKLDAEIELLKKYNEECEQENE